MLAIYFPVGGNAQWRNLLACGDTNPDLAAYVWYGNIAFPKERTSALRLFVCIGIFLSIFGFLEAYALMAIRLV